LKARPGQIRPERRQSLIKAQAEGLGRKHPLSRKALAGKVVVF
jgi:hypothetical protein